MNLMDKAWESILSKEPQQADNEITESRNEIVCPYCGHSHHNNGEDSFFYLDLEDFDNEEYECKECGKTFFVSRATTTMFYSSKKELE